MVVIHWKNIVIAGVAGFACGNIFSHLKKRPDVAKSIASLSVTAGLAGSVLGLAIAEYKSRPLHLYYSISLGVNYATAMVSFLGIRYWFIEVIDRHQYVSRDESKCYLASGGSGMVVGTLFAKLSKSAIVFSSVGGLLTGILGQLAYNRFQVWRKHKAIEIHYPELSERGKWDFEKFERSWLEFWHGYSRSGQLEADITLIEEEIKAEKLRLSKLNEQLAEYGITNKLDYKQESKMEHKTMTNINTEKKYIV